MQNLGVSFFFHLSQQYVKAKCRKAMLPPVYTLELLTIYAWEMGTHGDENFSLEEGLTTVMELLKEYEFLCIYWTKNYTFQNPIIEDFVRKEFKRQRYWVPACQPHLREKRKRMEGKEVWSFKGGLY